MNTPGWVPCEPTLGPQWTYPGPERPDGGFCVDPNTSLSPHWVFSDSSVGSRASLALPRALAALAHLPMNDR